MDQIIRHLRAILFLFIGFLPNVAFTESSHAPSVRVVVNTSVADEQISVEQMRRIFSMRQTAWSNDQSIVVYVLVNQHKTHQTFSTKILGLFPYQLDRIWNKLVYSGLGEQPIKVQNEQEMLERVSQQPGAIGYVMQQSDIDNVKTINVLREY